jgi:hypothetical protein
VAAKLAFSVEPHALSLQSAQPDRPLESGARRLADMLLFYHLFSSLIVFSLIVLVVDAPPPTALTLQRRGPVAET